jgi:hypothetical protein
MNKKIETGIGIGRRGGNVGSERTQSRAQSNENIEVGIKVERERQGEK